MSGPNVFHRRFLSGKLRYTPKKRRGVLAILGMLGAAAVSIAIAFIIGSAILPTSVESMVAVDTANWSSASANLWNQIPTFGIIAFAVGFLALPLAMIMLR